MNAKLECGLCYETNAMMTEILRRMFRRDLSQFEKFTNAYIAVGPDFCGPAWVIEARAEGKVGYAVLEGYDSNGIRNAYFYVGNQPIKPAKVLGKSFSTGGWQALGYMDRNSAPALLWRCEVKK